MWADQKNYSCGGLGSIAFEETTDSFLEFLQLPQTEPLETRHSALRPEHQTASSSKTFVSNEKIENTFVAENMDSLAKDIARGHGEYLDTFAGLIAVPESQKTAIYASLQANFQICTSDSVSYLDVLRNIDSVIASS